MVILASSQTMTPDLRPFMRNSDQVRSSLRAPIPNFMAIQLALMQARGVRSG